MDAAPILIRVAALLDRHGLDVVLIGNAAAALQGAPVTTIDIDFLFRRTPSNLRKLKAIARDLEAVVMRPYYPVSGLFRITRDADGLQLNFKESIDGARSLEALRRRSRTVRFGETTLHVAPLLPASLSRSTTLPKSSPIPAAEPAVREPSPKKRITRQARLKALKKESDLALTEMIRRQLALPPKKRTNFLRKRVGICQSCL